MKRYENKFFPLALLSSLFLSSALYAQAPQMPPRGAQPPAFAEFDLDGNGAISEQEFNQARSKRIAERAQQGYPMRNLANAPAFADIDSNGDGSLSQEEFARHQASHRRVPMQQ